ncbi:hypothetical protein U14_01938 [Candidatus Moduliflexus flocculans]|uniref:Uncharacterized protein n=1 Tax=Candidatus Moduliflexus flocculans TaxID=1499966 RepID=A0A0S6VYL3_9BACT|nr:hypothetical protein U14_01938 [Candidatus Moduliflexus flocculans]
MKKYSVILIIVLLSISSESVCDEIQHISLIQLIAHPEKYHQKIIRIEGYFHYHFEDVALYLSKIDADYLIGVNAVWLSFAESATMEAHQVEFPPGKERLSYFSCKYVLIEGRFNQEVHGHLGAYSGTIEQVTRIQELTRRYDGEHALQE